MSSCLLQASRSVVVQKKQLILHSCEMLPEQHCDVRTLHGTRGVATQRVPRRLYLSQSAVTVLVTPAFKQLLGILPFD
jgi:hypothetical protein